jgi:hypothetical protein
VTGRRAGSKFTNSDCQQKCGWNGNYEWMFRLRARVFLLLSRNRCCSRTATLNRFKTFVEIGRSPEVRLNGHSVRILNPPILLIYCMCFWNFLSNWAWHALVAPLAYCFHNPFSFANRTVPVQHSLAGSTVLSTFAGDALSTQFSSSFDRVGSTPQPTLFSIVMVARGRRTRSNSA